MGQELAEAPDALELLLDPEPLLDPLEALELPVPMVSGALQPPFLRIALNVGLSMTPLGERPMFLWKAINADRVF